MVSFAPYNFTIPDQSPTFKYSPYGDGDRTGGWNVSYTGSADSSFVNAAAQAIPSGTSFHRTSFQGASVNISWTGTACYLYGDAPTSSYTTTLDNGSPAAGSPVADQHLLAVYSGLEYGGHTLTLDVVQSQEVVIQAAVLTVGVGSPSHVVQNTTLNTMSQASMDLKDVNPAFQLSGSWFPFGLDPANRQLYPFLVSKVPGSSISYILRNTSAFIMYADCYWDHSLYSVQVRDATDPTAPVVSMQGNGSSRWLSEDCILYYQSGMDRDRQYEVTFQNIDRVQSLHYVTIMDGSAPSNADSLSAAASKSSSSPLPKGVIAAITVVVFFGVICLCAVLFVLLRMRKKRRGRVRGFVDLTDEDVPHKPELNAHVTPYIEPTFFTADWTWESRAMKEPIKEETPLPGPLPFGPTIVARSELGNSAGEISPPEYDPAWAKKGRGQAKMAA